MNAEKATDTSASAETCEPSLPTTLEGEKAVESSEEERARLAREKKEKKERRRILKNSALLKAQIAATLKEREVNRLKSQKTSSRLEKLKAEEAERVREEEEERIAKEKWLAEDKAAEEARIDAEAKAAEDKRLKAEEEENKRKEEEARIKRKEKFAKIKAEQEAIVQARQDQRLKSQHRSQLQQSPSSNQNSQSNILEKEKENNQTSPDGRTSRRASYNPLSLDEKSSPEEVYEPKPSKTHEITLIESPATPISSNIMSEPGGSGAKEEDTEASHNALHVKEQENVVMTKSADQDPMIHRTPVRERSKLKIDQSGKFVSPAQYAAKSPARSPFRSPMERRLSKKKSSKKSLKALNLDDSSEEEYIEEIIDSDDEYYEELIEDLEGILEDERSYEEEILYEESFNTLETLSEHEVSESQISDKDNSDNHRDVRTRAQRRSSAPEIPGSEAVDYETELKRLKLDAIQREAQKSAPTVVENTKAPHSPAKKRLSLLLNRMRSKKGLERNSGAGVDEAALHFAPAVTGVNTSHLAPSVDIGKRCIVTRTNGVANEEAQSDPSVPKPCVGANEASRMVEHSSMSNSLRDFRDSIGTGNFGREQLRRTGASMTRSEILSEMARLKNEMTEFEEELKVRNSPPSWESRLNDNIPSTVASQSEENKNCLADRHKPGAVEESETQPRVSSSPGGVKSGGTNNSSSVDVGVTDTRGAEKACDPPRTDVATKGKLNSIAPKENKNVVGDSQIGKASDGSKTIQTMRNARIPVGKIDGKKIARTFQNLPSPPSGEFTLDADGGIVAADGVRPMPRKMKTPISRDTPHRLDPAGKAGVKKAQIPENTATPASHRIKNTTKDFHRECPSDRKEQPKGGPGTSRRGIRIFRFGRNNTVKR